MFLTKTLKFFQNRNNENSIYNPQMDQAILSRINFISLSCIFLELAWLQLPSSLLLLSALSKLCSSQLSIILPIMFSNKIMQNTSSNYNVSLVLNVVRWHLLQNFPSILPYSKSTLNHSSKWWVNMVKPFFLGDFLY